LRFASVVVLTFTVLKEAFTAVELRSPNVPVKDRHGRRTAMQAEAFDPFGLKGAMKNTLEGFMDATSDDEQPSREDEAMVMEIFSKYDVDKDES